MSGTQKKNNIHSEKCDRWNHCSICSNHNSGQPKHNISLSCSKSIKMVCICLWFVIFYWFISLSFIRHQYFNFFFLFGRWLIEEPLSINSKKKITCMKRKWYKHAHAFARPYSVDLFLVFFCVHKLNDSIIKII